MLSAYIWSCGIASFFLSLLPIASILTPKYLCFYSKACPTNISCSSTYLLLGALNLTPTVNHQINCTLMASREMSWQSAFWSLPPLAINTMMQPSGRVCGFDPSLRTYLRSSPIVCAFDTVSIIVRFVAYSRLGLSAPVAAKIIEARRGGNEDTQQKLFLKYAWFVFLVLPKVIKLMACSGLPWTQVWGCFYLLSFIVVEVMDNLARFAVEELESAGDDPLEKWLGRFEKVCGGVAVLLQLAILGWIDLAVMPPDSNMIRKWMFRLLRLSAHFVVFLIYAPLMALQSEALKLSPNRRLGNLVMAMLAIFIILTAFQRLHFSQLYFMFSIIISSFAWLLYFFPVAKTHVLLCEPGDKGHKNVLAFDFFCRVLCFSLFWYVVHYNPNGTFKPEWAEVFG